MAKLNFREKRVIAEFLETRSGYVLNFSDKTFAEFFEDFEVDIDGELYREGHSGSKAKRLWTFLDREPDRIVADVLTELIDYAESYRPSHSEAKAYRAIVDRLRHTPMAAQPDMSSQLIQIAHGQPLEIFFSYAHEDEDLMDEIRRQLVVRERLGQIVKWHDRKIPAGDQWRSNIDRRIEQAHVILLFMSPHFLESRYCFEVEGKIALRRHQQRSAKVIPVVLRACDWTVTPFGELQALPKDAVPFNQWADRDQASLDIARGIMDSISLR
jgi:hypothetical protein